MTERFECQCGNTDNFAQVATAYVQRHIDAIYHNGVVNMPDATEHMSYCADEPLPDGSPFKDGGDFIDEGIDFYICLNCNRSFVRKDFDPMSPEKIAEAMAGLATLTQSMEDG